MVVAVAVVGVVVGGGGGGGCVVGLSVHTAPVRAVRVLDATTTPLLLSSPVVTLAVPRGATAESLGVDDRRSIPYAIQRPKTKHYVKACN